jgi:ferredoxin
MKEGKTMPRFVNDTCIGCGACVDTCPVGVIVLEDTAKIDAAGCIDCGACEGVCPVSAIAEE